MRDEYERIRRGKDPKRGCMTRWMLAGVVVAGLGITTWEVQTGRAELQVLHVVDLLVSLALGLLLLTSLFGYGAFALFTVRQSGMPSLSQALDNLRLSAACAGWVHIARHVIAVAYGPAFLWLWAQHGYNTLLAVSALGFAGMVYAVMPHMLRPVILFLAASREEQSYALGSLTEGLPRFRTVSLLHPRSLASKSRMMSLAMGARMRTRNEAQWREVAEQLMDQCKLIVFDERTSTAHTIEEADLLRDNGRLERTVVISESASSPPWLAPCLQEDEDIGPWVVRPEEVLPTVSRLLAVDRHLYWRYGASEGGS